MAGPVTAAGRRVEPRKRHRLADAFKRQSVNLTGGAVRDNTRFADRVQPAAGGMMGREEGRPRNPAILAAPCQRARLWVELKGVQA